jgi:hypothetical protein
LGTSPIPAPKARQIAPNPLAPDGAREAPEGHVLRFNAQGKIIGLTIINAKWLLRA